MLLVVNAGSSSLKLAVFDGSEEGGAEIARAHLDRLAAGQHADALTRGLSQMGVPLTGLTAAAHRIVHGGPGLTAPCRITPAVLAEIEACAALAPLHNPAGLAGIRAVAERLPRLPQCASFDTAFHATNPEVATTYALPRAERDRGLRRYGFHGLSYASLVRALPPTRRLLAFHLGNGASACAILDGRSVAATMGFSPLDGLTMGTRAGALDPAIVLDLAARHGVQGATDILNRDSGLRALGGSNDMRALAADPSPDAAFARAHFAYWAARHGGSLIAALGGLDAIAFTGGIGENDAPLRAAILSHLGWTGAALDPAANAVHAPGLHSASSPVAIWTVPAREEAQIAAEAALVLRSEVRA